MTFLMLLRYNCSFLFVVIWQQQLLTEAVKLNLSFFQRKDH